VLFNCIVAPGQYGPVFVAVAEQVGVTQAGSPAARTVTVEVAVPEPQEPVPVTVYVVVAAGVAVTVAPLVALNPVAGAQLYVFPPVAVSVALWPGQIVSELTDIGVKVVQLMVAVPKKLSGTAVEAELKFDKQIKYFWPQFTFSSGSKLPVSPPVGSGEATPVKPSQGKL
jgi:hypothetical protein